MIDSLALLLAPLAAGVLATLTHTLLGREVLARGIVFIDLAVAQCAALGALVGSLMHLHGIESAVLTLVFALTGALAVAGLCARWPERREAMIGSLYIGAASLAALLASRDPHGVEHMNRLLAGDVLWSSWAGLVPLAGATVLFFLMRVAFPGLLRRDLLFYPAFAVIISLSLPMLGLYLVFATLIIPALAGAALPRGRGAAAMTIGVGGYAGGLVASLLLDWPSGPTIVLTLLLLSMPVLARRSAAGTRHDDVRGAAGGVPSD